MALSHFVLPGCSGWTPYLMLKTWKLLTGPLTTSVCQTRQEEGKAEDSVPASFPDSVSRPEAVCVRQV